MRRIRELYLRIIYKAAVKLFPLCQRLGFHILPRHYYMPIPDTRTLDDHVWTEPSDMMGIDMADAQQLETLTTLSNEYRAEYDSFPSTKTQDPCQYYDFNGMFAGIDAVMLYSLVRHLKPSTIIEIGAGFSTRVSAHAIQRNRQDKPEYDCELVAIEPYPQDILRKGFPGFSRLIERKVQDVSLDEFDRLSQNDILFIDSSHVSRIGSDVNHEFFRILPRLKSGVLVHLHDIHFPLEYPKAFMKKHLFFWNEQYLLQAFLMFNRAYEVIWSSHYMNKKYPEELEKAAVCHSRDRNPSSFWMRRV